MESDIDLFSQTSESVHAHNAKKKPGSDLALASKPRKNELNDFSCNIKEKLWWLREPLKWAKPYAKAELESLAKSLGEDAIEQLKTIEKTLGFPLKDKQKIAIIKWLSGSQQSKIKAGKKTDLVKAMVKQEAYRTSFTNYYNWGCFISKAATYTNSALTACINLSDISPEALTGMTAYIFEGIVRPMELYVIDLVNNKLIVAGFSRLPIPISAKIGCSVALSILLTKPGWDEIEKIARYWVRALQKKLGEKADIEILTQVDTPKDLHLRAKSIIEAIIAGYYAREFGHENGIRMFSQLCFPTQTMRSEFQLESTVDYNQIFPEFDSSPQESAAISSDAGHQSDAHHDFQRLPTFDIHPVATLEGDMGIAGEVVVPLNPKTTLNFTGQVSKRQSSQIGLNLGGGVSHVLHSSNPTRLNGHVNVMATPNAVNALIGGGLNRVSDSGTHYSAGGFVTLTKSGLMSGGLAGSVAIAEGALEFGYTVAEGFYVSCTTTALSTAGCICIAGIVVVAAAGFTTSRLLEKRDANLFVFLTKDIKSNRALGKLVHQFFRENGLSKNKQARLDRAWADTSGLSDNDKYGRAILKYHFENATPDAIAAFNTNDAHKLVELYDKAFTDALRPLDDCIKAGKFHDACNISDELIKLFPHESSIFLETKKSLLACINLTTYNSALSILSKDGADKAYNWFNAQLDKSASASQCRLGLYIEMTERGALPTQLVDREEMKDFFLKGQVESTFYFTNEQQALCHYGLASLLSKESVSLHSQNILENLQKAYELDPYNQCFVYALADFHCQRHEFTKARVVLNNALVLVSDSVSIFAYALANRHCRRFEFDEAKEVLRKAGLHDNTVYLNKIEKMQLAFSLGFATFRLIVDGLIKNKLITYTQASYLSKIQELVNIAQPWVELELQSQAQEQVGKILAHQLELQFNYDDAKIQAYHDLHYTELAKNLSTIQNYLLVIKIGRRAIKLLVDDTWDNTFEKFDFWFDDVASPIVSSLIAGVVCVSAAETLKTSIETLNLAEAALQEAAPYGETILSIEYYQQLKDNPLLAAQNVLEASNNVFWARVNMGACIVIPIFMGINKYYYQPLRDEGDAPLSVHGIFSEKFVQGVAKVGGLYLSGRFIYFVANSKHTLDAAVWLAQYCPSIVVTTSTAAAGLITGTYNAAAVALPELGNEIAQEASKAWLALHPVGQAVIVVATFASVSTLSYKSYNYFWYNNSISNITAKLKLGREKPEEAKQYFEHAQNLNKAVLDYWKTDKEALSLKDLICVYSDLNIGTSASVKNALDICNTRIEADPEDKVFRLARSNVLIKLIQLTQATQIDYELALTTENADLEKNKLYVSIGSGNLNYAVLDITGQPVSGVIALKTLDCSLTELKNIEELVDYLPKIREETSRRGHTSADNLKIYYKDASLNNQKSIKDNPKSFEPYFQKLQLEQMQGHYVAMLDAVRQLKSIYGLSKKGRTELENNETEIFGAMRALSERVALSQLERLQSTIKYFIAHKGNGAEEDGFITNVKHAIDSLITSSQSARNYFSESAVADWSMANIKNIANDSEFIYEAQKEEVMFSLEEDSKNWLLHAENYVADIKQNEASIIKCIDEIQVDWSKCVNSYSSQVDKCLKALDKRLFDLKNDAVEACSLEELKLVLNNQINEADKKILAELSTVDVVPFQNETKELSKHIPEFKKMLEASILDIDKQLEHLVERNIVRLVTTTFIEAASTILKLTLHSISDNHTRLSQRQIIDLPRWGYGTVSNIPKMQKNSLFLAVDSKSKQPTSAAISFGLFSSSTKKEINKSQPLFSSSAKPSCTLFVKNPSPSLFKVKESNLYGEKRYAKTTQTK